MNSFVFAFTFARPYGRSCRYFVVIYMSQFYVVICHTVISPTRWATPNLTLLSLFFFVPFSPGAGVGGTDNETATLNSTSKTVSFDVRKMS